MSSGNQKNWQPSREFLTANGLVKTKHQPSHELSDKILSTREKLLKDKILFFNKHKYEYGMNYKTYSSYNYKSLIKLYRSAKKKNNKFFNYINSQETQLRANC